MQGLRHLAMLAFAAIMAAACGGNAPALTVDDLPPTPDSLRSGERMFHESCASCHGPAGTGSETGPPLIHRIYEPSHHGDEAFQRAVALGVRAHHWRFGDMAPVPDRTREEVSAIIAYLRWVQRQAGIE